MNLIVVESPTKARTLSRFLGSGYSVEATMGHIKDLPKEKLSVDVENNFTPQYVVVAKKADAIKKIQNSAQKADLVYIATDPDREGEAIAKHVEEILVNSEESKVKSKQLSRIVFHEITKDAVLESIKNPRGVDEHLVDAQIARRVLDRLVGYKLSPLLWKKVRRGLSAGRVQSVTVRLIVEREREIEAFKTEEYWEIFAEVSQISTRGVKSLDTPRVFVVKLTKIGDKTANVENQKQSDAIVAELTKADYKVGSVRKREVNKSPYAPFTTSTMTQSGARFFGWSAKRTMSIAQKLYEEGLITYHRTDSTNLSLQAIDKARNFISKTYGHEYLPQEPRIYKTKSKLAQEAHEAIRPTEVDRVVGSGLSTNGELGREHEKLYELIWKRFVACQMSNCMFDESVIDVLAGKIIEGWKYLLRVSGLIMKFDGWRKVIPLSKDEEPALPVVEVDELLKLIKVDPQQKFTQPPPRYNEASLIKTLEKLGIGRPSTYAPIITTIQVRSYVEKDEAKFKPTPIGIAVSDFLVKNFSEIVDYSFTADMERKLDDIAKGDIEWRKMMKTFYDPFDKKLGFVEKNSERVKIETEKLGRKCPTCEKEGRVGDKQGELVIRTGRFGKFISCSLFPECKHTEKYINKLGVKCPDCKEGDVIIKTTKRNKKFYGCSRYPACKWASWRKPELVNKN